MTRSIDNAFLRTFSKQQSIATSIHVAPLAQSDKIALSEPQEAGRNHLRIEMPEAGSSPMAAPHGTFQTESVTTEMGTSQIAASEFASLLTFSTDTNAVPFADVIPIPTEPTSPAAPPQPHIRVPDPEQSPATHESSPADLNQAAVERILRQREDEMAAANERSLKIVPQVNQTVQKTAVEDCTSFQPAWEVDVFQWPETVEELSRTQTLQFEQAGQQLRQAASEGLHVLGVTSTFRGEGRTCLSMCIARAVAQTGARVALVDLDTDQGNLALSMRVRPTTGWREVIHEGLPLEEAVIYSMEDGVALVPLEGEQGPRIGLRDPRTVQFIDRLSAEFDLVVLDCGPLVDENKFLEGGDACPLNAAIVVRDMRTTSEDDCQATVARLLNHGVEAIGIAENFNR
jgi:Mrp family chromosome partitioning ATPase